MAGLPQKSIIWVCLTAMIVAILAGGCAMNQEARITATESLDRFRRHTPDDAATYGRVNWATNKFANNPSVAGRKRTDMNIAPPSTIPESLRDFIIVALQENPDILSAEEMVRSKAARVPQVTALPDPMITSRYLPEPIRTAEGDNPFIIGIQQKLLVPEKLERAGRIALEDMRMALEVVQATRLRVIAEVKRAYFRIYVIDQTILVDRANQELLRGLIDVARAQTIVGKRGQEDVLRAQVELSNLESKVIELEQERKTVVARLNRLLNRAQRTEVPAVAPFDLRRVDSAIDDVIVVAEKHNPDLARLRTQIERDREAIKLAKLQSWPDFTVGLEWIYMEGRPAFRPPPNPMTGMSGPVNRFSEGGSDNWAITLGFNLPIWTERIRGGIEEARRKMLASQHQFTAERNRVSYEIEDALARVQAQQELAILFRDTIIPQSQQAYEVSRAAYTAGTTNFLFVIDNWQRWLTFTIQYHRALGELEKSIADLEQTIGLSLGELEAVE